MIEQLLEDSTLYTLRDVSSYPHWNFEEPTLVSSENSKPARVQWTDVSSFRDYLSTKHSEWFRSFPWDQGWVMGGKPLHDVLFSLTSYINWTFYLVDESGEQLDTKFQAVLKSLSEYFEQKVQALNGIKAAAAKGKRGGGSRVLPKDQVTLSQFHETLKLTRTSTSLELQFSDDPNGYSRTTFTFYLTTFASAAAVMKSIATPCYQILYDGSEIRFTALSRFCTENYCNVLLEQEATLPVVLELSRRFDLILPKLPMQRIKVDALQELGQTNLFCERFILLITKMRDRCMTGKLQLRTHKRKRDDESDEDDEDETVGVRNNVECVLMNLPNKLVRTISGSAVLLMTLDSISQVVINRRMIRDVFLEAREKVNGRLSSFVQLLEMPSLQRFLLHRGMPSVRDILETATKLTVDAATKVKGVDVLSMSVRSLQDYERDLFQQAEDNAAALLENFTTIIPTESLPREPAAWPYNKAYA